MVIINPEEVNKNFLIAKYHKNSPNFRQRKGCLDLFFSFNIPDSEILRYLSNGIYKLNQTKNCFYFQEPLRTFQDFIEVPSPPPPSPQTFSGVKQSNSFQQIEGHPSLHQTL